NEEGGEREVRETSSRRRPPARTGVERTGTETNRDAPGEDRRDCTVTGIVGRQDECRSDYEREVEAELVKHPSQLRLDTHGRRDHRHILGPPDGRHPDTESEIISVERSVGAAKDRDRDRERRGGS